jgi:hypothetical protein
VSRLVTQAVLVTEHFPSLLSSVERIALYNENGDLIVIPDAEDLQARISSLEKRIVKLESSLRRTKASES